MSRASRRTNVVLGAIQVSLRDRMRVVITGGGVAALETLLALRAMAGHLVSVTILSPASEFAYRPVTVAEAFDRAQARVYDLAEILADQGADLVPDGLAHVLPRGRMDVPALRELLGDLVSGRARSLALALPSERVWGAAAVRACADDRRPFARARRR